jgi:hypothetical protein
LRWQMKSCNDKPLVTSRPMWSGAKKNNRLLVWAEQGIGDQILFASMLRELEQFPQQIIVSIDKRLIQIFTRSFPSYLFVDRNEHIDEVLYDEQIPICSLGQFFRRQVSDFRSVDIPYLYENPINLASIGSTLNFSSKIKCGISWKSHNPLLGNDKSIPLVDILKILDLKSTHYINLQYGDTSEEINLLDNKFKELIFSVPNIDNLNDIDGLLSIINACDVIITVCNSTAHLAGAAGKEVLLLTPYSVGKFWYWQDLDGTSLFYPTVKVFKQQIQGDWSSPLNQIKTFLELKTKP